MNNEKISPKDVVAVLGPMSPNMYAVKYFLETIGVNSVIPYTPDGERLNDDTKFGSDNIPVKADRNRLQNKKVIFVVDCAVLLPSTSPYSVDVVNPKMTFPTKDDSTLLMNLVNALDKVGRATDSQWMVDQLTEERMKRFIVPLTPPSVWLTAVYKGSYVMPASAFIEYQRTQLEFDLSHIPGAKTRLSKSDIRRIFKESPVLNIKHLKAIDITGCDIPEIERLLILAKQPFFKRVDGHIAVFADL